MKKGLKKIHHLIRYTVVIGASIYVLYLFHLFDTINLFLIGPAVHIAYLLKGVTLNYLPLPSSSSVLDNALFLFPVTIIYYGFAGFMIKTLLNERGRIRTLSLVAYFAFLAFIHAESGLSLLSYLTVQS